MRLDRQHKPDSMSLLFLLVTLGMLISSIAHADNYLFSEPGAISSDMNIGVQNKLELNSYVIPGSKNSWLIPGSTGMRTSFQGGMAHFQFDSRDEGEVPSMLPGNTRFVFSMGLEEDSLLDSVNNAYSSVEWYDRYKPMLYLSVGHRW